MAPPPLVVQTTYAELLERCRAAAFDAAFPPRGVFTAKTIRGRKYWYFQASSKDGRRQKYVGPETPELLRQVDQHNHARDDEGERRALVSTLVRSFGAPRPAADIGAALAAMANAGAFRLRAVLVGTVAFQTYSAMLGRRLPAAILQTGDVDIAQFSDTSVAVEDRTPPMLDILKETDASFRAVPSIHKGRVVSYAAKGGLRVDFLTPNQGRESDRPRRLAALQTDALPLRFLDFLIHDPEPAVILHGSGIFANVPAPQRYAVHKLMIASLRRAGVAKREKDLRQVDALLQLLLDMRPYELKSAWQEAYERGKEWRRLLDRGLEALPAPRRQKVGELVGPPLKRS